MNFNRIFFICTMMVGMQMVAMEGVTVVAEPGKDPLTALTMPEATVGEHEASLVKRPSFIAAQDGILKIRRNSEFDLASQAKKKVHFGDDTEESITPVETTAVFDLPVVFEQLTEHVKDLVSKRDKKALEDLRNFHQKNEKFSKIIQAGCDELEQAEKEQTIRIETGSVVADSGVFKASDQSKDTGAILLLSTVAATNNSTVPLIAVEKPAPFVRQESQLKLDTNPKIKEDSTPQPSTSGSTAPVSLTTPTKPYNWKAWLGIGAGVAAVAATVIWYFWSYQKPIASH